MTLEARRKNQGKQYTVVSPADKVIRYWHRPGDHLPVMLTHAGKDYLLTKEVVEEARVHQRSKLVVLQVDPKGDKLIPAQSKLHRVFTKPSAQHTHTTIRAGSATDVIPVAIEVNWDVVGIVVGALFVVGALATFLTLGA